MGAYSPSRLINEELEKKILNNIIDPTLRALKEFLRVLNQIFLMRKLLLLQFQHN